MKYKFIDKITSDVMFEAYGKDMKEVFVNAALALSEVICQPKIIKPEKKVEMTVKGDDAENLLFNWLQEIIAAVDTDEVFLTKFDITEIDDKHLKAVCHGETISVEKSGTLVKALTYYKFKLEKNQDGYVANVTLDI